MAMLIRGWAPEHCIKPFLLRCGSKLVLGGANLTPTHTSESCLSDWLVKAPRQNVPWELQNICVAPDRNNLMWLWKDDIKNIGPLNSWFPRIPALKSIRILLYVHIAEVRLCVEGTRVSMWVSENAREQMCVLYSICVYVCMCVCVCVCVCVFAFNCIALSLPT